MEASVRCEYCGLDLHGRKQFLARPEKVNRGMAYGSLEPSSVGCSPAHARNAANGERQKATTQHVEE